MTKTYSDMGIDELMVELAAANERIEKLEDTNLYIGELEQKHRIERDQAVDDCLDRIEFPDENAFRPAMCVTSIKRIRSILGVSGTHNTVAAVHSFKQDMDQLRIRCEALAAVSRALREELEAAKMDLANATE